jgi:hypothetical protein
MTEVRGDGSYGEAALAVRLVQPVPRYARRRFHVKIDGICCGMWTTSSTQRNFDRQTYSLQHAHIHCAPPGAFFRWVCFQQSYFPGPRSPHLAKLVAFGLASFDAQENRSRFTGRQEQG